MTKTYRYTGILILLLAATIAVFGIGSAKRASADTGKGSQVFAVKLSPAISGDMVARVPDAEIKSGWFPLDPKLVALCGIFFECKTCWEAECQAPISAGFVSREPGGVPIWIPVPDDFAFCHPAFAEFVECKCIGPECGLNSIDVETRKLKAH